MSQKDKIILSRFGGIGGMGDVGPFALKTQIYMKMAEIEFMSSIEDGVDLYAISPTGQCPYIRVGDKLIADSNVIINYLEEKFDDPLNDKRLNKRQVATGKLLKSLVESECFRLLIYGRWLDGDYKSYIDQVWPDRSEEESGMLYGQYFEFVKGMVHGWGLRLDDPMIYRGYLRECLDAINEFMGDGPYLFGESPSNYDASLFGILSSLVHFPIPNPQVKIAHGYPKIVNYCDRLREEFFSDEDWVSVTERGNIL